MLLLLAACDSEATATDEPADTAADADADADADVDADADADGDTDTDDIPDYDPFVPEELIDGGGPDYAAGWAIGRTMDFCTDWMPDVGIYYMTSIGMGTDGTVDPAATGYHQWKTTAVSPSRTDFVCTTLYGFHDGVVEEEEVILESFRYVPGWNVDYTEAMLSIMVNSTDIPGIVRLPAGEPFVFELRAAGSTRSWEEPQFGTLIPAELPATHPIILAEAVNAQRDYLLYAIDGITGELYTKVAI